jgi:predicted nucleic acid-binding protein
MSSQKILIDSSFLYAVFNAGDKNHTHAARFITSVDTIPLVPEVVLPEVAFLFERDLGHYAIERFLGEFALAQIQMQPLTTSDILRAQQILQMYATAQLDLVDSLIMALSERLQITRICTFDRRDFSIFRPKHCEYLELLP